MPKGIITQFIVAMHPLIDEEDFVWREGVVLEKDGAKAEVIESYDKREIRIRVSGKQRKELLTIVAYELDRIHSTYRKRLRYNKWIPCNCESCKGSQEPHFYRYEILREFVADRQYKIQCQKKPYKMVDVLRLIDDVIDVKKIIAYDENLVKDDMLRALQKGGLHLTFDARNYHEVHQQQNMSKEQKTEVNIEIKVEQAIEHLEELEKIVEEQPEEKVGAAVKRKGLEVIHDALKDVAKRQLTEAAKKIWELGKEVGPVIISTQAFNFFKNMLGI
jgi:hypothetical protein